LGFRPPVINAIEKYRPLGRINEAYEMLEEGALSTTASPHDDEDVAGVNGEGQILLEDKIPIGHRQVLNDNMGMLTVS